MILDWSRYCYVHDETFVVRLWRNYRVIAGVTITHETSWNDFVGVRFRTLFEKIVFILTRKSYLKMYWNGV